MKQTIAAITIAGALLAGCASPTPSPIATPTQDAVVAQPTAVPPPTAALSPTPTEEPIPTPSPPTHSPMMPPPTPTPVPTATPVPQTLGRIFPQGYDSPGVWSNTPSDRTDCDCLHFDVGLPYNLVLDQDPVLSPASGRITRVYAVPHDPSEGQVVEIEPDPPLADVDEMISSAGFDPSEVQRVLFILAHITPWKTEGWVEAGEPVGSPFDAWFEPNVIGYVIIVRFRNGWQVHFSPCSLPNTASFCGKCYPGTPYRCP